MSVSTTIGVLAVAFVCAPVTVTLVWPGATPVTTPVLSTVAMAGLALVKV